MKYIQNNGRYAIAFTIVKNGRDVKVELDRKRIFRDTGNIATTGITEVDDDVYEELSKIKRFANMIKSKELELTEASKIETAETKMTALEKENAELKAQLEANPKAKELKEKDKEIADLKAQLEALSKKEDAPEAPKADAPEAPKADDESEGF